MTTLEVDIGLVDSRISQLFAKESVYDRQKSRLSDLLDQFLASLPTPKDLSTATPLDIVRFLVWKDGVGKTQVHVDGCRHRGLKGPFQCGCPTRLAAGTVDSMIGKLRAIFQEQDRAGDWESGFGLGNPAASLLVRKYLKHIREEQAAAGVTPRQAVPLFVDKLARLVDHIDGRLEAARSDPLQTYILVRDQAYFKTLFFSGDRPGDLGVVRTNEILRFPNDDGLLFNHTWGKTLRGGKSNLFGIKRCVNTKICPVAAIERYMAVSRAMQVDLTEGFLFRPTTTQGTIANSSVSSEAMNARLKTYLRGAGLDDGETAHSFRSGCAVTLALSGSDLAEVMGHVGWERAHTARYYMQLEKVLRHDSTCALMAAAVDDDHATADLTQLYQDLNSVRDFVLAFPPLTLP
jgi:integrase